MYEIRKAYWLLLVFIFSALWVKEENMSSDISVCIVWIIFIESTLKYACDRLMLFVVRQSG